MSQRRSAEHAHELGSNGSIVATPVEDLIEEAVSGAPVRGRRISVHIAPHLPLAAVDPIRAAGELRQALTAALANTPEGSSVSIGASAWKGSIDVRIAPAGGAAQVVNFPEAPSR